MPQQYEHVLVFEFTQDITADQFKAIVSHAVEQQVDQFGEINLVYILNTDLSNFTAKAWFEDAMLGLRNIAKWNKCAIVTDKEGVQNFTDFFGKVIPGEFKAFDHAQKTDAIAWTAS